MKGIPDWLIYTVVLVAIVYSFLSQGDEGADAPQSQPPEQEFELAELPPPSAFDPDVFVRVENETRPGVGTAFSVGESGIWFTARHVVDGCSSLAIVVGRNRLVPVERYETYRSGDLAFLYTAGAPDALDLALNEPLKIGEQGFHIGYPQGRPGEVASRLISRATLNTRGRYRLTEPVLAWAETGRTRGLSGSLGGMSGGPIFNAEGEVVGVTVAEAPRRGRIYTAAPASLIKFIRSEADEPVTGDVKRPLRYDNYGEEADRLRRNRSVVKVVCRT